MFKYQIAKLSTASLVAISLSIGPVIVFNTPSLALPSSFKLGRNPVLEDGFIFCQNWCKIKVCN